MDIVPLEAMEFVLKIIITLVYYGIFRSQSKGTPFISKACLCVKALYWYAICKRQTRGTPFVAKACHGYDNIILVCYIQYTN